MSEPEKTIKVVDRRLFTADGELRAEAEGLFIAFDPGTFQQLLEERSR